MKNIEPIQLWTPQGNKEASFLNAYIINDNLESSATFYWELRSAETIFQEGEEVSEKIVPGVQLNQGNVSMSETDYDTWDNSNEEAYAYIAKKINVVLI